MSFGVIRGDLGLAGYRRVVQPENMLDYSECTDTVSGHAMSIQAWRTPNGIFRNYRRFDRYDDFAMLTLSTAGVCGGVTPVARIADA